jgi:hypothetical protein
MGELREPRQVGITLSHLVPQEPPRGLHCVSMTTKAQQAHKHDYKQDDVSNTRHDHRRLAGLDVDRLAEDAESFTTCFTNFTCIAELSEGLARKV